MLDIGWTELLLIGVVALIVVGPKDLPGMFRTLGKATARMRSMAREFQKAIETAADETGVKDVASDLRDMTSAKRLGLDSVQDATRKFKGGWKSGLDALAADEDEKDGATAAASGTAAATTSGKAADASGTAAATTSGKAADASGTAAATTSGKAADASGTAAATTSGKAADASGKAADAEAGSTVGGAATGAQELPADDRKPEKGAGSTVAAGSE